MTADETKDFISKILIEAKTDIDMERLLTLLPALKEESEYVQEHALRRAKLEMELRLALERLDWDSVDDLQARLASIQSTLSSKLSMEKYSRMEETCAIIGHILGIVVKVAAKVAIGI